MKDKRNINGVKDTNQNYKGKVYEIIKKIIAIALSLGIVITAAQAIRMYNQWRASKTQGTEISAQDKLKDVTFEDVKSLIEEYREAQKNNDTEKIESLEAKLSEGNYFGVLLENFKRQMVESLGFDPEKVEVFMARDGVFLIDKEKAKDRMTVDHTGQINSAVKYIGKDGKNPTIPSKMKKMVSELGEDMSAAKYKKMSDLEYNYSNFEYLEEYEVEIETGERE